MKLKFIHCLLIAFIYFTTASNAFAGAVEDYDSALVAYKSGDYDKAFHYFQKAAKQGNVGGQWFLGFMYANGEGVLENDKEAVKWYRKAAEQGDSDAQYYLGGMYAKGEGVLKNDKEAVKWWRKSAEQGFANAQHNMGVMYANGKGVLENDKEAARWYRKAAEQGYAVAQLNLGLMYADGIGVLGNYTEAYAWLILAKFNGADADEAIKIVSNKMTNSDISKGQQRAQEIQIKVESNK